jgi:parallel beta-helix repeat protein
VDAAAPGDRIKVCAGTYVEQVTVPAAKSNIRLRSVQPWQAVIKAPAAMVAGLGGNAIVRITEAQNVAILGFTITGPGPSGCNSLNYGVRVEAGGSAFILGNHITQIRDEPFSGCQNGVAIGVGRSAESTTGSAWIIGNLIDNYQKNGPTVSGTGSTAVIAYNRVFGIGPTAAIAQNGIQVSGGATASVLHNFVAQNIYSPQTVSSSGILLFASGKVVTEHNTVTSNDVDIYMYQAGATSRTVDNRVRASSFEGVVVQLSSGTQVAHNWIDHNTGPGIGVYDAQNNGVSDNRVEYNDDSGILLGDVTSTATGNTVKGNWVRNNGTGNSDATDGIRLNATATGNTIRDNRLRNNVTHDCHDASLGVANTWTNNRAQTSFPTGLCRGRDDDSDSERSTSFGWNSSVPWYLAFGEAADPGEAATVNTESVLQLAPAARTGAPRTATPSPEQ